MTLILDDEEHKNQLEEKLDLILDQLTVVTELLKTIAGREDEQDEEILDGDHATARPTNRCMPAPLVTSASARHCQGVPPERGSLPQGSSCCVCVM